MCSINCREVAVFPLVSVTFGPRTWREISWEFIGLSEKHTSHKQGSCPNRPVSSMYLLDLKQNKLFKASGVLLALSRPWLCSQVCVFSHGGVFRNSFLHEADSGSLCYATLGKACLFLFIIFADCFGKSMKEASRPDRVLRPTASCLWLRRWRKGHIRQLILIWRGN